MSETTIATGTYTIENVDRRNDIFLAEDSSGTLVAGSSEADADPPLKALWRLVRLRNGRYTISPAAQRNKYASCPSSFSLGSVIVSSPTAHDWVIKETRVKETFVISHVQHQLYWGIEDDTQGSPVRLRHLPTGTGNQWKFCPCQPSTTNVPQGMGSLTIDGSEVDCQTTPSPSQTRNVNDERPAVRHILEGHTNAVRSVAYSPDGECLASGSFDDTIRVWDVRTRCRFQTLKPITAAKGHRKTDVCSVAFSPDGKYIVSGSGDKTVRIWDVQNGTLARTLNGHTDWVRSVAYSPDGKWVVSVSEDRTVRMWDAETVRLVLGPLLGHTGLVRSVNFSSDGKQFLSCSSDATIRIWNAETGHTIRTFHGRSTMWSAIFSPDSKQIVSGSDGGYVEVWDMQSGDSIVLNGHKGVVHSVGFSPDGGRIVSGGEDNQIIVWDAQSGHALGRLNGHTNEVNSVSFSPDGKWIVSGSDDRMVRIWEADKLDAMSEA